MRCLQLFYLHIVIPSIILVWIWCRNMEPKWLQPLQLCPTFLNIRMGGKQLLHVLGIVSLSSIDYHYRFICDPRSRDIVFHIVVDRRESVAHGSQFDAYVVETAVELGVHVSVWAVCAKNSHMSGCSVLAAKWPYKTRLLWRQIPGED